ncbi:hypothetical protein [Streptomyces sp. NPDC006307]|uniref:hypothetical protein n=1 Tax=Streptomyces sp. NPDC006307 TaxID=3156748 RepID=UPI0033AAD79D
MQTPRVSAPLRVGDTVTGRTYVSPEDKGREQPQEITGTVVQVGSGFAGVDAEKAFVWVRLPDCTERKCLIRDVRRADERSLKRSYGPADPWTSSATPTPMKETP